MDPDPSLSLALALLSPARSPERTTHARAVAATLQSSR